MLGVRTDPRISSTTKMNAYPADALHHFTPLALVTGLTIPEPDSIKCQRRTWSVNSEPKWARHINQGERLASTSEPNISKTTLYWRLASKSCDLVTWNAGALDIGRKKGSYLLNLQFTTDRNEYLLPPVKSLKPYGKTGPTEGLDMQFQYPDGSLHSPLSPLNSASELYPDGIISEKWIQKYLRFLPSTIISVHKLNTTAATNEEEAQADIFLTTEITTLKRQLTGHGIKLIAVIVSDAAASTALDNRIYYLRKNTGLAARTGLFFLPPSTDIELETLVETICQQCFYNSTEFYNKLTKNIRKKRGAKLKHSSAENTSELSASLISYAGWDIRYSYKLAALMEFRQELESSMKAYEKTYDISLKYLETLCPPDNISPARWCELREFMDILAFRIVKLNLYAGTPHTAYKKFCVHLDSIAVVIEACGFSKDGFAYKHWKAQQFELLGNLLDETADAIFPGPIPVAPNAEMDVPGDCLPRSGSLYLTSARYFFDLLEHNYIEGDKVDPYLSESPSSLDLICQSLRGVLKNSSRDFSHDSIPSQRCIAYSMYLLGEAVFLYDKDASAALVHYRHAANIYRRIGWPLLLEMVLSRISEASSQVNDLYESILSDLELGVLGGKANSLQDRLAKLELNEIDVTGYDYMSIFSSEFAFEHEECYTGVPIKAQLKVTCNSPENLFPDETITLDWFRIEMSGELAPISITHNKELPLSEHGFKILSNLILEDNGVESIGLMLTGEANLTFKRNQSIVFEFTQVPRTLGEAYMTGVTVLANCNACKLKMSIPVSPDYSGAVPWRFLDPNNKMAARFIRISNSCQIKLTSRPSLVKIKLDMDGVGVLGEKVHTCAIISNSENENIFLSLQVKGITNRNDLIAVKFKDVDSSEHADEIEKYLIRAGEDVYIPLEIAIPESAIESITIEFKTSYVTASDEDAKIFDHIDISMNVTKSFMANFDVNPRVNPKPLPCLFIPSEENDLRMGASPKIQRLWELTATISCHHEGEQTLKILGSGLQIVTTPDTTCTIVKKPGVPTPINPIVMKRDAIEKATYTFMTERFDHEGTQRATAEAHFTILWQRPVTEGTPVVNKFTIAPVRFNLPLIEPRVLVGKEIHRATADLLKKLTF